MCPPHLTKTTVNGILFLELMDYPESDEDSGAGAADIASGTAILDTEDMETALQPRPRQAGACMARCAHLPIPPRVQPATAALPYETAPMHAAAGGQLQAQLVRASPRTAQIFHLFTAR
jgi:hypothetical protein